VLPLGRVVEKVGMVLGRHGEAGLSLGGVDQAQAGKAALVAYQSR